MATNISRREYVSDLIVDLLRKLDIDYISLNPGSSFRFLHESIVNYGGNRKPEIVLCCHEEIAIAIAHGYAKACGKPMAAAVHNIVGLLHGCMAIYNVWVDQTPVLIIGGTGPMAVEKRRPWIDWIHTALVQGDIVRNYVKWDDQPASVDSIVDSFYRGYRASMSEPKGPVYICIDLALQEQRIAESYLLPEPSRYAIPSPPQADPSAIRAAARMLVNAKKPVVVADYLGRNPAAVESLVELSELLSIPVVDGDSRSGSASRLNFPNTHPLDLTEDEKRLMAEADVVLGIDMADFSLYLTEEDRGAGTRRFTISETAKLIHVGLNELMLRGWSANIGKLIPLDLSITADSSLALPALVEACKEEMKRKGLSDFRERYEVLKQRHESMRGQWREMAEKSRDDKPISLAHAALELWKLIEGEDWVLVNGTFHGWARRLWNWTKPNQWLGSGGGAGVGYGISHSIGAALALKGSGKLCIDLQPDGDLLYTPSALWTAAHHRIPLLIVMHNNRSYYNSENHQFLVSKARGRCTDTKAIGTRIEDPPVDFAAMARSFGLLGVGPVDSPGDVQPALEKALRYVKEQGMPALVDLVTSAR